MTAATTAARARPRRARVLGWGALAVALLLVAAVGTVLAQGGWSERDALDPESAGPDGTRALARILAAQGVEVEVTRDRAAALRALERDGAALALPDAPGLSDAAVQELADAADAVVLLQPRSRTLRVLTGDSSPAGASDGSVVAPGCDAPAAAAGATVGDLYAPGPGVTACYPRDDGFGLLVAGDVSAVDARAVAANDVLDDAGNAALALALLGSHPRLVWYVPGAGDSDTAAPTLGELTPGWVTPSLVLLLVAAGVAALWRGRRFGPLVRETLPVTVRASETTTGRGRLYARSGDRAHAARILRHEARARLARLVGQGGAVETASARIALADAVALRSGADAAEVRRLLGEDPPADDRALVRLDAELRRLEAATRAGLRPVTTEPPGREP